MAVRAWRERERRRAVADPLYLVSFMSAVDERDGSRFSFEHVREPLEEGEVPLEGHALGNQDSWRWQRLVAELFLRERRLIVLKGRQIGVTWLWLAVDVARTVLAGGGTTTLLYRQREDEAIDNVRRWWVLFDSLPAWWKLNVQVLAPERSVEAIEASAE